MTAPKLSTTAALLGIFLILPLASGQEASPSPVQGESLDPQGENLDPQGESLDGDGAGLDGEGDDAFESARPGDSAEAPLDAPLDTAPISRVVNPDRQPENEAAPLETYEAAPLPVGRNELQRNSFAGNFALPPGRRELGQGVALTHWLQLQAFLRHSTFYDTNVNREDRDEDDDVEFNNTLGVDLTISGTRAEANLGYAITFRNYIDDTSRDQIDHRGRFGASWRGQRLTLGLTGGVAYLNRPEDPEFNRAEVERLASQGRFSLEYQFTRVVGLVLESTLDSTLFQSSSTNQFDQLGWGGNAFVSFDPGGTWSFLAGGTYRELLYLDNDAPNPDLGIYAALVGVQLDLVRFLDLNLRVGYEKAQVLKRRNFVGNPPDGLVTTGRAAWTIIPGSVLSLELSRQITFSVTAASRTVMRVAGAFEQELPAQTRLFLRSSYEDQELEDAPDIRFFTVTFGAGWTPFEWLDLGTQAGWEQRGSRSGGFEVFRAGISLTLRL